MKLADHIGVNLIHQFSFSWASDMLGQVDNLPLIGYTPFAAAQHPKFAL